MRASWGELRIDILTFSILALSLLGRAGRGMWQEWEVREIQVMRGCMWEDNIQVTLKEMLIGCGLYSSGSGYGPETGCCEHGNGPWGSISVGGFLAAWAVTDFSIRTQLHGVRSYWHFLSRTADSWFSPNLDWVNLPCHKVPCAGRDSAVDVATRYGVDGSGIESRRGRDFPHLFKPALGPTQLPVQCVSGWFVIVDLLF
jgi:hypothetical protein